ncbi:MAG: efflux RND transporter periplasmic adaptor subunit [Candidatus Aminicenantes bacterium]|nr:efflux RND transporter periplasmic adaptor subunit [Candidatus Aminicenantes bacterium]
MKAKVLSVLLLILAASALILMDPFDWRLIHRVRMGISSWLSFLSPQRDSQEGQLWTCGMHPQVIRQGPGSCPLCGMRLSPLKETTAGREGSGMHREGSGMHSEGSGTDHAMSGSPASRRSMDAGSGSSEPASHSSENQQPDLVRIDPSFVQNFGVQSIPVRRADLSFTIRTVGNLVYDEGKMAWINTRFDGWIEKAHVNYVGEPVQEGQKLLEIYSPELVRSQQEYLQAMEYAERLGGNEYPEVAERARSLVESSRRLLDHWDLDSEQIRRLEESREPRRTVTLVSPVGGVVVEKMDEALEGMRVHPGMNLYKIADPSSLWVEAEVFEHQIPWMQVGQEASIEISSLPGRKFRGAVRFLSPAFSGRTRTLKVSLELIDPDPILRADMYANVTFDVSSVRGALAVPEDSVIHSGRRNLVVLDLANGAFQVREVVLGRNGNGFWEVRKGLSDGDQVVISSQFLIDSESRLKEAIRKIVSPNAEGATGEPAVPMGHQH